MSKIRGFEEVKKEFRTHKKEIHVEGMGTHVLYADIHLPVRGTRKSACYDFFLPVDVLLLPAQKTIIWSDCKAYMQDDEYLAMHIRSSLGIKQGIILSNVTGIIDADYYENEANDGNIGFALLNTSGKGVELKAGERVCQGVFQKYLLADNDVVLSELREGGSGSSGK